MTPRGRLSPGICARIKAEAKTEELLHGQTVNYSGLLHSNEYRRNVRADNVTAQVIRDEKRNLLQKYKKIAYSVSFLQKTNRNLA